MNGSGRLAYAERLSMWLANLSEEKEDLSRIRSVRSNDGYLSAAPVALPSQRNTFAVQLGRNSERLLAASARPPCGEVRALRELRRCDNVPNACCCFCSSIRVGSRSLTNFRFPPKAAVKWSILEVIRIIQLPGQRESPRPVAG